MENDHPSRDIIGSVGRSLSEKKIALCVTGSVAAVRSPDIARLLMRHGAEVYPVMSAAATHIIHPDLMEWATGHQAVTELSGAIEHVALAGNVPDRVDMILVAPATANTIGKIAAGIDDTPVTSVVTTGLGEGIPLLIVPAMHEPMYRHVFVRENIEKLRGHGIRVLMPRMEEGKAKIAENEEILLEVLALMSRDRPLAGRRVLVTAGRTVEYLDPVRVITNNSSGKMGIAIAEACRAAGAEVTLVHGKLSVSLPRLLRAVPGPTAQEMADAVAKELDSARYDVVVAAAAVGDWKPEKSYSDKVSTHDKASIEVRLVPTAKIIDGIKSRHPDVLLVAFRALYAKSREALVEDAHRRLRAANADLIAVNDVSGESTGFEADTNELYLVAPDKSAEHVPLQTKRQAAERLVAAIARCLGK